MRLPLIRLPARLPSCLPIYLPAASLRASGVRLLRAALICVEGEALPLLPTLLLALRSAVADDDGEVARHAVGCLHVLGVTMPVRSWMPLAAEGVAGAAAGAAAGDSQQLAGRGGTAQRTAAALVALSALLYAAGQAGSSSSSSVADCDSLQLAVAALGSASVAAAAGEADGLPVRQQLLAACTNLVSWAGPSCSVVAPQLFQLLLQLWAIDLDVQSHSGAEVAAAAGQQVEGSSSSSSPVGPTAAGVLVQLAAALGSPSPSALCSLYGPALLQHVVQVRWGAGCCCCCCGAAKAAAGLAAFGS